ncbi:EF-hand domain-containing protein [Sphaerisporangium aureirubrum]|uniref:EF-hand domain-containing protein n=1 Tax=Sphaerisporangium aureirubrum TaxID=1544736 RepID=A0ABW1NDX5_9ACTN
MSEYAVTFDLVDADKDGLISAEELLHLMEVLGQPVTREAADAAVGQLDVDGDGLISLEEFSRYLSSTGN